MPAPSILDNVRMSSSQSGKSLKFVFVKKHEICRPSNERDKCCRVMAVSEYQVGNIHIGVDKRDGSVSHLQLPAMQDYWNDDT